VRRQGSFIARVRWREGVTVYWVGRPNNSSPSSKIWAHNIVLIFLKFYQMHLIS
jgi:hypothetical protein